MTRVASTVAKARSLHASAGITRASDMPDHAALEYVVMPEWWQKGTNTKGIAFRRMTQISGDSDSGKTSCSIAAIKAAIEQGVEVLYIETEGKTTKKDFTDWGVDPSKVYILQESIAEDIYDKATSFIDSLIENAPGGKLLLVIDSLGNVLSQRDADRSLSETDSKPGGKGSTNRAGLNQIISRRNKYDIAILAINYTYDNIGSHGKTSAGGKSLKFFSSLIYFTSRKGWIESTVKGQKVRKGAKVVWKLDKNHIDRANPGPKVIELDITSEGIKLVGTGDD